MNISPEELEAFKKIYNECYGTNLNDEQAYAIAVKLYRLVTIVYEAIAKHSA